VPPWGVPLLFAWITDGLIRFFRMRSGVCALLFRKVAMERDLAVIGLGNLGLIPPLLPSMAQTIASSTKPSTELVPAT
jgi:hypothetical protein